MAKANAYRFNRNDKSFQHVNSHASHVLTHLRQVNSTRPNWIGKDEANTAKYRLMDRLRQNTPQNNEMHFDLLKKSKGNTNTANEMLNNLANIAIQNTLLFNLQQNMENTAENNLNNAEVLSEENQYENNLTFTETKEDEEKQENTEEENLKHESKLSATPELKLDSVNLYDDKNENELKQTFGGMKEEVTDTVKQEAVKLAADAVIPGAGAALEASGLDSQVASSLPTPSPMGG